MRDKRCLTETTFWAVLLGWKFLGPSTWIYRLWFCWMERRLGASREDVRRSKRRRCRHKNYKSNCPGRVSVNHLSEQYVVFTACDDALSLSASMHCKDSRAKSMLRATRATIGYDAGRGPGMPWGIMRHELIVTISVHWHLMSVQLNVTAGRWTPSFHVPKMSRVCGNNLWYSFQIFITNKGQNFLNESSRFTKRRDWCCKEVLIVASASNAREVLSWCCWYHKDRCMQKSVDGSEQ